MLVPKWRFKREDGTDYPEWEEKAITDLCEDIVGGGTPSTDNKAYWSGDIAWVSSSDLENNNIHHLSMTRFITENAITNSATKRIPYNSILIVSRVGVGKVAIAPCELCTSQDFTNLVNPICNPIFLGYLLSLTMQIKANGVQGTSIKGVTAKEIKQYYLSIPHIEEQQKIADFLSTVDEVIAQSEAEVQNLEQQKKEVRFKREDGTEYPEWVESTIGEEMSFVNGKAHENCEDDNGDYIIVNSKFISTNGEVIRKTNTVLVPLHIGDIVMVMSDVPNGKAMSKCLVIDKDKQYTLNQRICVLRSTHKPIFVSAQISRCAYFMSFDDGVKQTNLRKQDVLDCPLFIADKEEQQKIADFLSAYDEAISYAKQELDKWKELKKGLLQQMFV